MSAREKLFEAMAGGWSLTQSEAARLNQVIDNFAHELATQQRFRMQELDLTGREERIAGRIIELIDPEAQR